MDPTTILVQGAMGLTGGALGAWIAVKVTLARLEERVRTLESEIGTHDTGIRGALHKLTNVVLSQSDTRSKERGRYHRDN